jgi:hypothetical protein
MPGLVPGILLLVAKKDRRVKPGDGEVFGRFGISTQLI